MCALAAHHRRIRLHNIDTILWMRTAATAAAAAAVRACNVRSASMASGHLAELYSMTDMKANARRMEQRIQQQLQRKKYTHTHTATTTTETTAE